MATSKSRTRTRTRTRTRSQGNNKKVRSASNVRVKSRSRSGSAKSRSKPGNWGTVASNVVVKTARSFATPSTIRAILTIGLGAAGAHRLLHMPGFHQQVLTYYIGLVTAAAASKAHFEIFRNLYTFLSKAIDMALTGVLPRSRSRSRSLKVIVTPIKARSKSSIR